MLEAVKGYRRLMIPPEQFDACVKSMGKFYRDELAAMITAIKRGVKRFVVPLNDGEYFHWHMLIVDIGEKKFYTRNSAESARAASAVTRAVRFLQIFLNKFVTCNVHSLYIYMSCSG